MKINFSIQERQPVDVITNRHLGAYSEIGPAFSKLAEWAGKKGLFAANPRMIGIYVDDPMHTDVEALRSDACIEDKSNVEIDDWQARYTIKGGKFLVASVEYTMAECGDAWCQAYNEVNTRGYAYRQGDHYEVSLNCPSCDDADAIWISEMCIPIE